MTKELKKQVLEKAKELNVKFIELWFTDVLGFLKTFTIQIEELEGALEDGMGFDGSSIQGFARIEESDMVAKPDPATFQMVPWHPEEHATGRMFADILRPNGETFDGDPRAILKRILARAKEKGFTFYVGPELEYFYFKGQDATELIDNAGYFDLASPDISVRLRRETILTLDMMGIKMEYSHHEVAPSQHEIDFRYTDALTMADNVMTYRLAVKQIAQKYGYYATFMPKPIFGQNGSGMHTHQSLFKGEKNTFFSKTDKYHLTDTAKHYIAGLLKHAREITAVTNQWVNSYKRLVPGYEAPVYVSWAQLNRSALIRVPQYKPGKEQSMRIEYRSPDPACNPYLTFAAMLTAGLDGIDKKYALSDPVPHNIYEMGEEQRSKLGIQALPEDLLEAIRLAEKSELVRKTLGDELFSYFIRNKKAEWDEYKAQLSKYELEKYLPIL